MPSAAPTQPGFSAAPKGVVLETAAQISLQSARIAEQTRSRAMPLGNLTAMTDEERAVVADWAAHEAKPAP